MSDRPVFIYLATYADVVGAEADYDAHVDRKEFKHELEEAEKEYAAS
jgi:hypothetical protein